MHYAALVIVGSDIDPKDDAAVSARIAEMFAPYYSDRPEDDDSPYPGLWDWYEIGGRYSDRLPLLNGKAADVARAGDVDWPAMSGKDREGRTYAVFTREGVETRQAWDETVIPSYHDNYKPHDCAEGWCKGAWIETAEYPEHWDALVAHLGATETVVVVDYHN